jgi:hypothetical protein
MSCTLPDIFKGLCPCHLIHIANPTHMGMPLSSWHLLAPNHQAPWLGRLPWVEYLLHHWDNPNLKEQQPYTNAHCNDATLSNILAWSFASLLRSELWALQWGKSIDERNARMPCSLLGNATWLVSLLHDKSLCFFCWIASRWGSKDVCHVSSTQRNVERPVSIFLDCHESRYGTVFE